MKNLSKKIGASVFLVSFLALGSIARADTPVDAVIDSFMNNEQKICGLLGKLKDSKTRAMAHSICAKAAMGTSEVKKFCDTDIPHQIACAAALAAMMALP